MTTSDDEQIIPEPDQHRDENSGRFQKSRKSRGLDYLGPPFEQMTDLDAGMRKGANKTTRCQWPLGDPKSTEFRYCGKARPDFTKPYCDAHNEIAYHGKWSPAAVKQAKAKEKAALDTASVPA